MHNHVDDEVANLDRLVLRGGCQRQALVRRSSFAYGPCFISTERNQLLLDGYTDHLRPLSNLEFPEEFLHNSFDGCFGTLQSPGDLLVGPAVRYVSQNRLLLICKGRSAARW